MGRIPESGNFYNLFILNKTCDLFTMSATTARRKRFRVPTRSRWGRIFRIIVQMSLFHLESIHACLLVLFNSENRLLQLRVDRVAELEQLCHLRGIGHISVLQKAVPDFFTGLICHPQVFLENSLRSSQECFVAAEDVGPKGHSATTREVSTVSHSFREQMIVVLFECWLWYVST